MANADQIKVDIERVIHNAIAEMVRGIWDTHSIRVNSVTIKWLAAQTVCESKPRLIVERVDIDTSSYWSAAPDRDDAEQTEE